MEQKVRKQSSFYQTRMNQAKLGAYYTDQEHCRWIAQLLEFPEGKEVCCLEPSIGDGEAVITVTGRKEHEGIHIFGVDLNEKTANEAMDHPLIEECIHGNFLTDVIITKNAFSFCFANPPYGDDDGRRLEYRFLSHILPYLKEHAVFVFVVPYYVAAEEAFFKLWQSNFSMEGYFRFHEKEFAKWRQVVLIGRKVKEKRAEQQMEEEIRQKLKVPEQIPLLPEIYEGKKIKVFPSQNQDITDFKNKIFDFKRAKKALKGSMLEHLVAEKIEQKKFIADRLMRPPIMPNAGQMYLMAISGAGQGRVGTKAARDQHLQRGIVTNIEESEFRTDDKGNTVEAVQRFTKINFNVIENDGAVHVL